MKQNPAIKYGLIGAVLLLAVGIIIQMVILAYLKIAANDPTKYSLGKFILFGIISLVVVCGVYIICIVKSIKDYRKIDPDYTYRKLVGQGLLATLILVVVSTGLSYLYNGVITPESKQQTIELSKQVYQNLDIPEDEKEKVMEKLNNQDPVRQLLTSVGLTLLLGMIVSLISASVLNVKATMNNPQQMR
jgi:O-antigen/teichoic acid export membrane protein